MNIYRIRIAQTKREFTVIASAFEVTKWMSEGEIDLVEFKSSVEGYKEVKNEKAA